jgi:hypothetical protein
VAFASVALQFPDLAAEQLEHGMKQLGLRGAAIGGNVNGDEISAARFAPFWRKDGTRGADLHSSAGAFGGRSAKRLQGNGFLSNVIGKLRRADAIACVRLKRQKANQNLGFTSRPFLLCGLTVKRPGAGQLLHERRNGHFLLQVTRHPSYGLPWGQHRLVRCSLRPPWLFTSKVA